MKQKSLKSLLNSFWQHEVPEAGVDEAGRGCYAGPVVAAAVILPPRFYHPLLNDSKQTKETDRKTLRAYIEKNALSYACAFVPHTEIDRINILQATYKAMHQAILKLKPPPGLLLIDGNRFKPIKGIPHHCVVGGDAKYASIAAASIIAKTYRDEYMLKLHENYPGYGWNENKGYGTAKHREAIEKWGLTEYHRKSFNIGANQLKLGL